MAVFKLPREIGAKIPDINRHVRENIVENLIFYMIDRKYRKVVNLKAWLKEQLVLGYEHDEMVLVAESLKGKHDDDTMLNILKYVHDHTTYITDDKKWDMVEKWEDVTDVFDTQMGDCESGATVIYVLARMAGISSDKVWMMCGDVQGGGHAWIGYIPDEAPLNFGFMDWCYWYKKHPLTYRNLFQVSGQRIIEDRKQGDGYQQVDSNYFKLWFVFNEEKSYRSFR